jgi:hypothetical protein
MSYEMMRAYSQAERETMAGESKAAITLREPDLIYQASEADCRSFGGRAPVMVGPLSAQGDRGPGSQTGR